MAGSTLWTPACSRTFGYCSEEKSGASAALVLFRTTDGGATWTSSPPLVVPGAIWGRPVFSDPDHGWIVGRRSNQVLLYRTTDAGESWRSTSVNELLGPAGTSVSFVDSQTGWLATWQAGPNQSGRLWKTTDGGLTWTLLVYSLQP
ncbi:MAG: WD40/YVTN/BNR-like repeat-containing protein [Symbiobacteriia bacterium]